MTSADITAELLRTKALPRPEEGSKEGRGQVLVIAGSTEVPGAALLSAEAAMRAGAGKLLIATTRSTAIPLALAVPEAMVIGLVETADGGIGHPPNRQRLRGVIERSDAVLIGPGMVEGADTINLAGDLCSGASCSFVLDAAALCGLRESAEKVRSCKAGIVVTPHAGEMAQFLGKRREDIENDPLSAAREASSILSAVVAMKGAETFVVAPDGSSWVYRGGNVGLATSGSGDVLAGVITGLLARGADPATAALWGVYLHGECGRREADKSGPIGFLARELAGHIPGLLRELA